MSTEQKQKYTKQIPFICEVIYKPVEGETKGLSDVRNITVVQNDSDTYKVKVYNVESEIHMFPIIPDSVNCDPGEQKPTGDMWTPWCDNQQALEEGHCIRITLSKKREDDHVYQLFQSGRNFRRCKWGLNYLVFSGNFHTNIFLPPKKCSLVC